VGSNADGIFGIFLRHNPSGQPFGPGVDSASNIYDYHKYFLRVKAADA